MRLVFYSIIHCPHASSPYIHHTPTPVFHLRSWDRNEYEREFPGSPVVRTPCFHCRGLGSVLGQGTKIPQAAQCSQKEKKKSMRVHFVHFLLSRQNSSEASQTKLIQPCAWPKSPFLRSPSITLLTSEDASLFSISICFPSTLTSPCHSFLLGMKHTTLQKLKLSNDYLVTFFHCLSPQVS